MTTSTSVHIGETINKEEGLNFEGYRDSLDYINHDRTSENIILYDTYDFTKSKRENLKASLEEFTFSDGKSIQDILDVYNIGKRRDRQKTIDSLLDDKVKDREKGSQPRIREQSIIFQVGGEERGQIDEEKAIEILQNTYWQLCVDFRDKMIFTDAYIHLDETTPHMEVHGIPVMQCEPKRGVPLDFSPNNVFKSMISEERRKTLEIDLNTRQEKNEREGNSHLNKYEKDRCEFRAVHQTFDDILINQCRSRGIEIENEKIEGRKHRNQDEYRREKILREEMRQNNDRIQRQLSELQNREYILSQERGDFEEEKKKQKQISYSLQARNSELIEKEEELIIYEKNLLNTQSELEKEKKEIADKERELENKVWDKSESVYVKFYEKFVEFFKLISDI